MNFKLPSMFKTPKPRQFGYKPIYYDEAKEDREKSATSNRQRFKKISSFPTNQQSLIKSNIRLIIIIIGLVLLAYYIINF